MSHIGYPEDWAAIRADIIDQCGRQCANCHRPRTDTPLEVHHIVPLGQAGSHARSNLVALCPTCHQAAHGEQKAPRVQWFTNDEMSGTEFRTHKRMWKQMRDEAGVPRYDPDTDCVYVPIADSQRLVKVAN